MFKKTIVFLLSLISSVIFMRNFTPIELNLSLESMFVFGYIVVLFYFIGIRVISKVFSENKKINLIIVICLIFLTAITTPMFSKNNEKDINISIIALEETNRESLGNEVWISNISADNQNLNLEEITLNDKWVLNQGLLLSNGQKPANLELKAMAGSYCDITFISNRWSGKVKVVINNDEYLLDLYDYNGKTESIRYDVDRIISNSSYLEMFILDFLVLFAIFWICSTFDSINKKKSFDITPSETNIIKAIAIILVIFSHLRLTGYISLPKQLNYLGDWGVVIFLLLSGYGLARSYSIKGMGKEFLMRRLKKVILPYSLVTSIWILTDYFIHKQRYSLSVTVSSLVGLDFTRSIDPTMWFVTFIIIWYVVFYFIFSLKIKNRYRFVILITVSLFFRYCESLELIKNMYIQWRFHAYAFPVGILWGLKVEKLDSIFSKVDSKIMYISKYLIPLIVILKYINNISSPDIYFGVNFSVAVILIIIVKDLFNIFSRSIILIKIGELSFEIYLVHFAFMTRINLFNLTMSKKINMLVYWLTIIVVAILLKRIIVKGQKIRRGVKS